MSRTSRLHVGDLPTFRTVGGATKETAHEMQAMRPDPSGRAELPERFGQESALPHPEDTALPDPIEGGCRKIRVLVADDHEILRSGLVALLEDHPELEVVGAAADGLMALELARATRPDVIIMDITMPRLNGIEATRRITRELSQVRVIGLSMHEREDMAAAMREAGAVAYLAKSGPTDELIAVILRR
jgi:CheY-like chemotaxis protein